MSPEIKLHSITYFQVDGTNFNNEADAEHYIEQRDTIAKIMAPLGPRPKLQHGTYIRHDLGVARQCYRDLVDYILANGGMWEGLQKHIDSGGSRYDTGPDWFERIHDGYKPKDRPRDNALDRFGCMDLFYSPDGAKGREYDQPYFVTHPQEAKQSLASVKGDV